MSGFALPERYELTDIVLGGGGMSDAVVCRDRHLDRPVVVKSLKSDTDTERLLDELAAVQAIRSKHVVQIYDVVSDKEGTIRALVEEYLPGDDLFSTIIPTSAEALIEHLYPIAAGIADIHAHGRIHRDIKPNNMKLDGEGYLKIFDFGLSRLVATGSTTNIVVTPGFAAPELFVATTTGRIEFTQAIDVFAFGATALVLAMGDLPAELERFPPSLPAAEADFSLTPQKLPMEIVAVLNTCLEVDSSRRPVMSEVRDALASHLLRDRHRALLVSQGKPHILDADKRVVSLSAAGLGSFRIRYDGQHFVISDVAGFVSVNNTRVGDGYVVNGSCVIILGSPEMRMHRLFITFDVAHPEVTL